jgi:chromate transporter
MTYLYLFWSFFQIGLFSIGGGLAAMPLIQHQVVYLHQWLTLSQFADIVTIAEMTPGPIAINSATFVGIQVAGIPGAIVATLGCILPSCIIVMVLAWLYYEFRSMSMIQGVLGGLRPAVVAMIASSGLSILILAFFGSNVITFNIKDIRFVSIGIFAVCIFVLRKFKINPIYVLTGAGLIGIAAYQLIF